jgi:hypothetical protein
VISSDPALVEIAGPAALVVDPHDYRALAEAVDTLAFDWPLRRRIVQRGLRHAQGFSWQRAAIETHAARVGAGAIPEALLRERDYQRREDLQQEDQTEDSLAFPTGLDSVTRGPGVPDHQFEPLEKWIRSGVPAGAGDREPAEIVLPADRVEVGQLGGHPVGQAYDRRLTEHA